MCFYQHQHNIQIFAEHKEELTGQLLRTTTIMCKVCVLCELGTDFIHTLDEYQSLRC
jgi:hypothetical protein